MIITILFLLDEVFPPVLVTTDAWTDSNLTDEDMVFLRYANVLLLYAQAKKETSGRDAGICAGWCTADVLVQRNKIKKPTETPLFFMDKRDLLPF